MATIRVLIYEDNKDLSDSFSALLRGTEGFALAGAFPNCTNIVEQLELLNPNVVLMDIDMPYTNGIEGLKLIQSNAPSTLVLMLTVFEDEKNIFDAILNGASGYLLKRTPPAKILEAITELYNGGAPMSPMIAKKVIELFKEKKQAPSNNFELSEGEKKVLQLLAEGNSVKMIADMLSLSADAIKSRIKKIYEKLHVRNMGEAVAKAIRFRIVE